MHVSHSEHRISLKSSPNLVKIILILYALNLPWLFAGGVPLNGEKQRLFSCLRLLPYRNQPTTTTRMTSKSRGILYQINRNDPPREAKFLLTFLQYLTDIL